MSFQLTNETSNQWLSVSSLAAVIAGVPPEVALGALGWGGNFCYLCSRVPHPSPGAPVDAQLSLRPSLLQTSSINSYRHSQPDPYHHAGLFCKKGLFSLQAHSCQQLSPCVLAIWLYHRSDNPRELIPGRKDDGNALSFFLLITNAVICTGIAIRVVTFPA